MSTRRAIKAARRAKRQREQIVTRVPLRKLSALFVIGEPDADCPICSLLGIHHPAPPTRDNRHAR